MKKQPEAEYSIPKKTESGKLQAKLIRYDDKADGSGAVYQRLK